MKKTTILYIFLSTLPLLVFGQHSVAREWNEKLLEAIRNDFARPTVHARNLFHSSIIMYDTWAVFSDQSETIFLGKTFGDYNCNFNGIETPVDVDAARHEMMSYALFRLLNHRFTDSPGEIPSLASFSTLFNSYGYDDTFVSTDYSSGSYAALGNYLASKIIAFGFQDGSNEQNGYENLYYSPRNRPLQTDLYDDTVFFSHSDKKSGTTNRYQFNPNRWQPLAFGFFIDQSGNITPQVTPEFLSPEWGEVTPFCLTSDNLQILNNGFNSYVYNDPGPPVYIEDSNENGIDDPYKWHFALVASWSAQLDPVDATMIDISPGALGNVDIENYPETFEEYKAFYDFDNGGDVGTGHSLNPFTNLPYDSQIVKRADYARALAEFWADGPNSETPPGHWFTILNYVSDHPEVVKKLKGQGPVLSNLEWDVKSYLVLGGAMHDAAVNTWGIKGYYDYVRPISAIRYMSARGQSSDANLTSYHPQGIPLIPGYIELIETGDPLAGLDDKNVGKIKIFAWKGPDFISDPDTDVAGVGWILGTHWWPYQRNSFVTPPFAGYLSGHSTFSRAAAEVITLLTGDAFFPGGMGTFDIIQNEFLVFEEGPSESFTLQWATYRDASDQTSLSRIWGGIHPPIDDIRGRIIGEKIGVDAFNLSMQYFQGTLSTQDLVKENNFKLYPNPFSDVFTLKIDYAGLLEFQLFSMDGKEVLSRVIETNKEVKIELPSLSSGIYFAKVVNGNKTVILTKKIIKN